MTSGEQRGGRGGLSSPLLVGNGRSIPVCIVHTGVTTMGAPCANETVRALKLSECGRYSGESHCIAHLLLVNWDRDEHGTHHGSHRVPESLGFVGRGSVAERGILLLV